MKSRKKFMAPFYMLIFFVIVIVILFVQFCYLSLSKDVYGINMKEFASNRNTVTNVLTANRGTIYDVDGNVLAQNISSYTLIAYLDSSRTKDESNPQHVVDKEYTATKLATILGEENKNYILERLNKNVKQVEFGSVGKNLTELTKLAIEDLELPGISFTESLKRYYPNGNFASYVVGYSKQYTRINIKEDSTYDLSKYYKSFFENYKNVSINIGNNDIVDKDGTNLVGLAEGSTIVQIKSGNDILAVILVNVVDYDTVKQMDSTIVGELGIESKYDDILQGSDGYTSYQRDKNGYQIPDTPQITKEAIDGSDIYLTIDSTIQRFAETAVMSVVENYDPEWTIFTVMDAKSGSILASATSPSFNPNKLSSDMNYQNPLVSYTYEPGSVMKIYTYMCAVETGKYDGTKKYLSGSYKVDDETTIHDWYKPGWGELSYDTGFSYSSNVAIINIINDYLSLKELKSCLSKYGFGEKTGIELSGEGKGSTKFYYDSEKYSAGFGQGITTTPVQQLQALSIIANNGVMVKPHIVSKVVDPNTKEVVKTKIRKSDKLVSDTTISKIKDLMESVINPESPTGSKYYLEGYNVIGKTGTAQIYENGRYLEGANDYVVSIALMYPKDDPQIIIYAASKKPKKSANSALPGATKELIKNINKYKAIVGETKDDNISDTSYTLNNYINRSLDEVKKQLDSDGINTTIIGDGKSIINQYPSSNKTILKGDRVFLITNNSNYTMTDLSNWSKSDVKKYCELTNINCKYDGYGYVESQSISVGSKLDSKSVLEVKLGKLKVDE